ncbi:hypothetical protein DPMN_171030 [Dreissena polymorpha]|uniref:Uncharacterized protein n=1 Tax=Dreissena polymorpha TaxID=45954 RepID=A0A9D4E0E5_DREPO|nr:hypothetical protein DPMN_171030 [Dreissena polymorpha]
MTGSIRDLDIRVPEVAAVATELADDVMDEMKNTADLIIEGDTVAVVAADENDDYLLLTVFPYSQD